MKIISNSRYEELLRSKKMLNEADERMYKLRAKLIESEKVNNGFAKVIDKQVLEIAELKKELKNTKSKLTKLTNQINKGEKNG